jgi:hypothetical protein
VYPSPEETIKLLIENNHGQIDSGPCLVSRPETITGVFSHFDDAKMVVKILDRIGIEAELYRDDPIEPLTVDRFGDLCECEDPSNYVIITFAADQAWVRREIVRLLTFDLVYGWQHFDTGGFLVLCKSEREAMYLFEKFEDSPVANVACCDFIEDFRELFSNTCFEIPGLGDPVHTQEQENVT